MKQLSNYILGLGFLLCASNIAASKDLVTKEDEFQYQVEVKTSENNNIQRMELPESVQSRLKRADAKDLQIYDSNGKLIPTYLEFVGAPESEELIKQLHFFPISAKKGSKTIDSNSLKFSYSDGNIEVEVDTQPSEEELETVGVIFENPLKIETPPEELEGTRLMELIIKTSASFKGSAGLVVRTSSDLNTWSSISTTEKIVNMNFMEQNLIKDRITIPSNASKFIMFTWRGVLKPEIESLSGVFRESSKAPDYRWMKTKNMEYVEEKGETFYQFKLSPALRSNSMRISNLETNDIYMGTLQNKSSNAKSFWRNSQSFTLYKIPSGQDYIEQVEAKFNPSTVENWRLLLDYPSVPFANEVNLEFNRHPIDIYFLPSGSPPFHLKFSRKAASDQPTRLSNTIKILVGNDEADIADATLAEEITEINNSSAMKINWKKILLWTALILGVIIMGWMARDLFKKLK